MVVVVHHVLGVDRDRDLLLAHVVHHLTLVLRVVAVNHVLVLAAVNHHVSMRL